MAKKEVETIIIIIILIGIIKIILDNLDDVEGFFDILGRFFIRLENMPSLYQYVLIIGIVVIILILYVGGTLTRRGRW
ncbi:MAG: hypothetical protein HXS44_13035 [Theionarchaea archaeon]|nr:hypothetical protein [Theionarchaea archaeon]